MSLRLLNDDDYECPRPIWQAAARETGQGDPFCCQPVWQLSFHRSFAENCRVDVRQDGDSVLAFSERVAASGRRCLVPLEPSWCFGSPLLGDDAPGLLTDALADWMTGYGACPDLLVSGLICDSVRRARFLRIFGRIFDCYLYQESRQCFASLSGGLDGFLSRRSANHRRKLKKSARRAADAGVVFERCRPLSPEASRAVFARMLAVEEQSWKGIGHCGMAEPPARHFYAVLLAALARTGDARVIFARCDGRDIGFIFGGMAGNVYRGQQFSFVDSWRPFSIGNLLQLEKIRWLCEDGVLRYDMGPISGPRMGYKAHWTENVVALQTLLLRRS